MSTLDTLRKLFSRDLHKLISEISSYQHEPALWKIDSNIANSAGNLCLHLVGNLNTYIGAQLGQSGYIRDREAEFSLKDIPRAELLLKVQNTITVVDNTLAMLSETSLEEEYPMIVFDSKTTTGYLLIHLATHLTYHLGQINYHRRLLDQQQ
ncbi:DinB family protein [Chitinophaga rhizophila]|uniref:DinB family protein n=1 Tax=Chitinophaga rhizophila TaxID=2866212 RepID=A0ABS7GCL0_9BACT|nr:DUF1572 family protein [Chitinophaga rhizophila]MBW8684539.1 DinB family protein [Chitinophaga rhizophila]